MKVQLFFFFLLRFTSSVYSTGIPVFEIDLDVPIQKRYQHVLPYFAKDILNLTDQYISYTNTSEEQLDQLVRITEEIYEQREFLSRVKAFSNNTGIPYKKLLFYNFMYEYVIFFSQINMQEETELRMGCTSIIIK